MLAQHSNPIADPKAIVTVDGARFTVLTPQMIRMEWSADGTFEDHASLVFINRNLSVPKFSAYAESGWQIIETDDLLLKYKKSSGKFTKKNLSIEFTLNGEKRTWNPGMKDTANLKGTTRTLDGVDGTTDIEPGLLSRDGWVIVDDSERPLFDTTDWQWVMPRPAGDRQDWYFFGYGHEYKKALFDFTQVSGKIPMPPRFAFGLWWSRYWAYTDDELKQLVGEFEQHQVPLDVLVVDMDWHQTFNLRWDKQPKDQAGLPLGWTGYTWDKYYFPDPDGFLAWCHAHGLEVPLNLHPASGIQPHELHYPEMAQAMGIDPTTKKYVPFDIVDKKFATNYMNLIIQPLEKQGVNFWWLDWQQWGTTKIKGVTPTWWLNYVFFTDMERRGAERPILFHRWGGLGNHRYEIGFSGDVTSSWESLAFQTYFTPTAANVGYGYWSHDIGGHIPGTVGAEMYTRWIQSGIFSPVIRTHTTKNAAAERRIWAYPEPYASAMRNAILLRYSLIPYIYSAARESYDTGVSLCRPMYYDYPESPEAYAVMSPGGAQYMFGDNMLVAPVASARTVDSAFAPKKIWLPEGTWIEWSTGKRFHGPATIERNFTLEEIPVYVKAGSLIPMQPQMNNTHEKPVDPLILTIFPGDSGSCRVYEDAGNSQGYKNDEFARTSVHQLTKNGTTTITISPVEGKYPGMIDHRSYQIRLPGSLPPQKITVNNSSDLKYSASDSLPGWRYIGDSLTTVITLPKYSVHDEVRVVVERQQFNANDESLTDGFTGALTRLCGAMQVLDGQWPKEWAPDTLMHAEQTGNRIEINPSSALKELQDFHASLPEILRTVRSLDIDSVAQRRALVWLMELDTWHKR
ncbi:MAG TPA: TIM-barrel domain-containing protein [Bacteroidota bacterium]|nr:TIM-barrel domain-containing protein [Bacteroidota bacterium]